jgi:hypothetical protein
MEPGDQSTLRNASVFIFQPLMLGTQAILPLMPLVIYSPYFITVPTSCYLAGNLHYSLSVKSVTGYP